MFLYFMLTTLAVVMSHPNSNLNPNCAVIYRNRGRGVVLK